MLYNNKTMFKKTLISLVILCFTFFGFFVLGNSTSAESIKVENIFSDIDSNYKYLHELQTLYDKWMIIPDASWKFNPNELLNRDEFVWILMEVTCKDCIQPLTSNDLITKFQNSQVFYDIWKTNKYFYCVEDANDSWFVTGYHPWTTCENWISKEWEKPFCPSNTIILEEAIAVILRASWILNIQEAEKIREDIRNWIITENISEDVSPLNEDGSVYSFYPDLYTALNYEVDDVDINWNVKRYSLIEKKDWKLRPKQAISKEKFLRIAYVALKANSCSDIKSDKDIALIMNIYDKECKGNDEGCGLSKLNNINNTYDFWNKVSTTCEQWVDKKNWYIRRFYNHTTWNQIIRYGKYQDDFKLPNDWKWQIFLRVIDKCWSTAEVYNTIIVNSDNSNNSNNDLKVSIDANPISWLWPLLVDLEWIVSGWIWPYSYSWDFWDWNTWYWKNIENIFKENWTYEVKLIVTDSNWKKANATVLIQVTWQDCSLDSDFDWINDCDDIMPLVAWDKRNKWAPILEKECGSDNDCDEWYICTNDTNVCLPKELATSCEYTWWDVLFWNVVCNTCPCNNYLDFTSTLRKCDIIFPAITSPDSKEIYSKWELYQIQK
jgi:hypothetical protein